MRRDVSVRRLVWLGYLLLLTAALVTPQPARLAHDLIPEDDARFTVAKSIHAAAYTVLALLTAWSWGGLRVRTLLLLAGHAVGTEIVQTFVPSRSGRWQDVVINLCGLTAGAVAWHLGRRFRLVLRSYFGPIRVETPRE